MHPHVRMTQDKRLLNFNTMVYQVIVTQADSKTVNKCQQPQSKTVQCKDSHLAELRTLLFDKHQSN